MRIRLIVLAGIFPLLGLAQNPIPTCEIPAVEGQYQFQKTISIEDIPSSKLYHAALISLVEILYDLDEAVKYKNEAVGVLMVGFHQTINYELVFGAQEHFFNFLLRLDFKDGRYRAKVTYVSHEAATDDSVCSCPNDVVNKKCGNICANQRQWGTVRCRAHESVQRTITDLEQRIRRNVRVLMTEGDW